MSTISLAVIIGCCFMNCNMCRLENPLGIELPIFESK